MPKEILILFGVLFLILFLGNVSAVDMCWVEASSADCITNNGQVVMSVSGATNAHGALAGQGSFIPVLCCGFGEGDTTCSSTLDPFTNQPINKILGLSSSTNAHAEAPDLASSNYNNDVCYDSLKECRSTDVSCGINEVGVLYISSLTNAHIEEAGLQSQNYDLKICCVIELAMLCDLTSAEWQYEEVMQGAGVGAIVNGTGCSGIEISFEVFRGATSCNSIEGCENPSNGVFAAGSNSVTGTWTAGPIHDNEYYFVVEVVTNPSETVQSSTPDLLVIAECPYDPEPVICSDYINENACNSNICGIDVQDSVPSDVDCSDPGVTCECVWENNECKAGWGGIDDGTICGNNIREFGEVCDGTDLNHSCTSFGFPGGTLTCKSDCSGFITNQCDDYDCNNDGVLDVGKEACDGNQLGGFECTNFDEFIEGTLLCDSSCEFDSSLCIAPVLPGSEIGTCIYTQFTDDTCDDDGFLTFSWTAEFVWAEGMGPEDDVKGLHLNCVDGQKTVECPAQIPLPFFNIYSFIATLSIIALIYVILILRKEKRKR